MSEQFAFDVWINQMHRDLSRLLENLEIDGMFQRIRRFARDGDGTEAVLVDRQLIYVRMDNDLARLRQIRGIGMLGVDDAHPQDVKEGPEVELQVEPDETLILRCTQIAV